MSLLKHFLSSSHTFKKEENFRYFQFSILNIILLVSTLFSSLALFSSLGGILIVSDIFHKVFVLYIITNSFLFYLLRKEKYNYRLVATTTMFISTLLFYFPLLYEYDEFRLIWFFLLLFVQFILLGKRAGLVLMTLLLGSIFLLNYYYPLGFSTSALFSFLNSLILFSIFMYLFIDKMEQDAKELQNLNQQLDIKMQTTLKEKREKEVLLQEVHHRVKNNLHIILSMIQLQQYETEDCKTNLLLNDLENRINTIAKTYEMLIVNDDLQDINMHPYVTQLLEDVHNSFSHLPSTVILKTNVVATMPLKDAVYVGLVINELVTNAYKYAFGLNKGEIVVNLTQENNMFTLTIKDNGIGFDVKTQKKSVGSKLVETLVEEQLQGKITLKSDNYTKYHITFSL
jgi:two-component sensor histidine kinase